MVRGITSATVVPTASGDDGEGIPSQNSHASISDEVEREEYAPEEEKIVSRIAELQSKQYLQAAFNGQISETLRNPNDPSSATPRNLPTTEGRSRQSSPEVPLHKPVQRLQSVVVRKRHAEELTKNYMELVKDFRQLRPFTRRPDGKYPTGTLCVYCVNIRPTSVFFPCQHMCVCNDCIKSNNIFPDYASSTDWCACPVCMADIRLILPHSGKEEERYWRWDLEIKPNLPSQFKQEFKETGKRLNKDVAPTPGPRRSFVTMFRRESSSQEEEASKDPSPKSKVSVLGRRHSWQSGEVVTVQNVAASNEQEEARNCSIL